MHKAALHCWVWSWCSQCVCVWCAEAVANDMKANGCCLGCSKQEPRGSASAGCSQQPRAVIWQTYHSHSTIYQTSAGEPLLWDRADGCNCHIGVIRAMQHQLVAAVHPGTAGVWLVRPFMRGAQFDTTNADHTFEVVTVDVGRTLVTHPLCCAYSMC